ncbi:MAG TPA: sigma-70 family RNA polymerase sigma factor, partial [Blastocatellia bacterium]|nr:sigma-70 family RNA polymerase sigma factor [Blastocatellia bacterium]
RARGGDDNAYESLVRRFQDMAVGYAYSILRNFHSAEDAAQEAFLEAYRNLDKLREPAAFPGWFRRIVFKQCDRLTRGKQLSTVPLDDAEPRASEVPRQDRSVEESEMKDRVLEAIDSLPEHERAAVMLYYTSGYTHNEIAAFLDVSSTAIKKRLHSARNRLREMLIDLVEDSLRERRPSRDELFATRVVELLKAARAGDVEMVKQLLAQDPRLMRARDPLGNSALVMAVNFGHAEVAELLFTAGVRANLHEAAAIGDTERARELLREEPGLLESYSPEGFTPLAFAAHFGHIETARFLIREGANLNAVSRHALQITPLLTALFGQRTEMAKVLIEHGADVNSKRGGAGWPRAGWTALHYSAGYGFAELVSPLIDRGADINALDDENRTPLQVALEAGQHEVVGLLRGYGASG